MTQPNDALNDNTNLTAFQFESFEVRFVGTPDDAWWVAQDVCAVLEHSDTSKAVSRLDNDEKVTKIVRTPGGNQQMLCVNESGLYSLVLTSRKPQAKRFKKWLTSEVIPSIRKTGSYALPSLDKQSSQTTVKNDVSLSVQDQLAVFGYIFDGFKSAGVDDSIVESAKLTALVAQFPNMAPAIEAAKESLMLQTPDEGHRYNPTDLGKKLAERLGLPEDISNRKINSALESVGLQVAEHTTNSKGKKTLIWHLTERGEVYGRLFLQSAQNNSKTVPSIRWVIDVLDEIVHLFDN